MFMADMSCSRNPFIEDYTTPYNTPPFHLIKTEHYEPAMIKGMEQQNAEVEAIVNNPENPTFNNTIVALERSGKLLERVEEVYFNLLEAESNDEMQELAQKLSPMLSEHYNRINLNERLFARV